MRESREIRRVRAHVEQGLIVGHEDAAVLLAAYDQLLENVTGTYARLRAELEAMTAGWATLPAAPTREGREVDQATFDRWYREMSGDPDA